LLVTHGLFVFFLCGLCMILVRFCVGALLFWCNTGCRYFFYWCLFLVRFLLLWF